MAQSAPSSIARQIETLFDGGSVAGLTDRQLIERFTARRDAASELAFAALVSRHGPIVLDICLQLLGNPHDADDAFQAVFLVLARKARSIGDPDLLANWLYGVALRVARNARMQRDRRRRNEEAAMARHPRSDSSLLIDHSISTPEQSVLARERAEALYNEIDRLPGPFRLPVVLCYFEGLTLEEAAQRLRCPAGTVRSRLARAYDKLRRGLTRRGVALTTSAVASVLASRTASACVSAALCETTARAAMKFALGRAAAGATSVAALALAHDLLQSMLLNKLKLTGLTLLFLGAIASGAGYVIHPFNALASPRASEPRPSELAQETNKSAAGRMFVTGRVLDPHGEPIPAAAVMVHVRHKLSGSGDRYAQLHPLPIGHEASDGSGQFRIEAPRTSSSRHDMFCAVALAPGYGTGWVELDPDADQPVAEINLRPEQVIHGRLFDVQGRPAPNVTVSVCSIGPLDAARNRSATPHAFDGIIYQWTQISDFPAWPKPVITDAEGRFTVRGVGRDLRVNFTINDPRFALQRIQIQTDSTADSKPVTVALAPAQIITGRVSYADTGRPVPHAQLDVSATHKGRTTPLTYETDGEGRFRLNPSLADEYRVAASPPAGKPYLTAGQSFEWPKGAVEHSIDLALPPGVMIRGKVTEEGSGQPVADARVWFERRRSTNGSSGIERSSSITDGSFQLAVPAAPGYLVIEGPSDDYVLREIGQRLLFEGLPGGERLYSHAFVPCDPRPGSGGLEINVVLRRGLSVHGQALGLDGHPTPDTRMFSPIMLQPYPSPLRLWLAAFRLVSLPEGRFQIHGLDPDIETPVYFIDPERKLGATAHLPGKPVRGGPITVRLEPCGSAKARLIGTNGKPIATAVSSLLRMVMVVTPGSFRGDDVGSRLRADEAPPRIVDPINYEHPPASDADGRISFPALIPGVTYRLYDYSGPSRPFRKEFTAKPGETLDLGDILIEKPATQ
jgi:RNA polymerase sigma factor (sigma-70 family)